MKQTNLSRFSVSLEDDLMEEFDNYLKETGYTNRSEAVRDLIREKLNNRALSLPDVKAMAAVVMTYNHALRELGRKLTEIQHHSLHEIVTNLHIHIDKYNCMEVVILKGNNAVIRKIAEKLKALKGVRHCEAIFTAIEE